MTDEPKEMEAKLQSVDLIVSGYEWTCPVCHSLKREIEAKSELECPQCESKFNCGELRHTFE